MIIVLTQDGDIYTAAFHDGTTFTQTHTHSDVIDPIAFYDGDDIDLTDYEPSKYGFVF